MNKNCVGCGIALQCDEPFEDGYVNPSLFGETLLCRRCFRLKHYGEYKVTNKSSAYYKNIINDIFKSNDLVLHIVDIFDMGNIDYVYSKVFSPCILVLSKWDIFPKSVNEEKTISYFKNKYPRYLDVILLSSDKNYNMDYLYDKILDYKTTNDVYVLGNTNAGKSSFINKMIKNYTENNNFIVTSYMPSTTLNVISIKINDELNLLDTPGLINDGNITSHLSESAIKDSNIKDEINPRIYQNKEMCSLSLTDIGRIDCLNASNISIYISNNVDINKINIDNDKYKDLELTKIKINSDEDLVIEGLCFIKCSNDTSFDIYMPKGTDIYKRDKII